MNTLSLIRSVVFVSIFAFAIPAFGQTAEMSLAEISAKVRTANTLLRQMPYRSISKPEKFDPVTSEPKSNGTFVFEIIPSGASRSIQITDGSGGFKRLETIQIDGRMFRKFDDRPWEDLTDRIPAMPPPRPSPASTPEIGAAKRTVTFDYRLLERANLDGLYVDVFQSVATVSMDGKKTEIQTTKNWISLDGLLRKTFFAKNVPGEKPLFQTTVTYEYDNIKIEAPIK